MPSSPAVGVISTKQLRIAVSGIPRGYHYPRPDGNWLQDRHKAQIHAVADNIELLEIPAAGAKPPAGVEVLLAEGGNTVHYPGELDQTDYQSFFTESLRWVQLCSTGFSDNITAAISNGQVTLSNAPGLHTTAIAESVIAAMLSHAKNLRQRFADQQSSRWRQILNDELYQRTVLIAGLGRIGSQVARLCNAFSMRVIGCKNTPAPVPHVDHVFPSDRLLEFLPTADYVVLAMPHTAATECMIDERALALLKPSTYLINVGRGRLIDETALVSALRNKQISGAYLDAFNTEPLPPEHPLWLLDNATIVPHDSHSSPLIGDRMVDLFCANLSRYVTGAQLQHVCDPNKGY